MGNREDLLAGARKVIMERGVAKATARDIAAAAGVSLAAIGYHFGSKDRLVTEALSEALGDALGDGMRELIEEGAGGTPLAGLAHLWNGMPAVFADNNEAMLASLENIVRIVRSEDARAQLGDQLDEAYRDLAADLRAAHPDLGEAEAEAIGRLYFVLAQGLGVLWLLKPGETILDGDRLSTAVRALAGR
ncbi:TetR family transcriptional regulator [Nocardia caishijiensis]|uniref:TetR family transcriptional regulator n=1 Tax=Nocardia caishijiensis TaxID=184756 RepID=A0ABQ6YLT7_9NOCA|nr:TetR family transcriptional regulator [Nocardia caishijiensis]KAF0846748.1 TetR family transcriptional regulator [Nocardia caishijiensis]